MQESSELLILGKEPEDTINLTETTSYEHALIASDVTMRTVLEIIPIMSEIVSSNVGQLGISFSTLAGSAAKQASHVNEIVDIAGNLEIDGEVVDIAEFNDLFSTTIGNVIEKIVVKLTIFHCRSSCLFKP